MSSSDRKNHKIFCSVTIEVRLEGYRKSDRDLLKLSYLTRSNRKKLDHLMNSIAQNEKNCKRYLPHKVSTKMQSKHTVRQVTWHTSAENITFQKPHYGSEFTNFKKTSRIHIFDLFCKKWHCTQIDPSENTVAQLGFLPLLLCFSA